jgi:hypothetical protein
VAPIAARLAAARRARRAMLARNHCNNWTSSAASGPTAQVGHFDRMGGGADPMSWSSAHPTNGCSAAAFVPTGGRGSIYCFAAD